MTTTTTTTTNKITKALLSTGINSDARTEERRALAEKIASEWGCEIVPSGEDNLPTVRVQDRFAQGFPRDGVRTAGAIEEIKAAGINTYGWLS